MLCNNRRSSNLQTLGLANSKLARLKGAGQLRGDYKQSDYGKVILPFTVLRRLDCVLAATKAAVLAEFDAKTKIGRASCRERV